MRDRLIELLTGGQPPFNALNPVCISVLADHFIENGVIVLPCKMGDKVYRINTSTHTKLKTIKETTVTRIAIDNEGIWIFTQINPIAKSVWGKTVFKSREEAEKALSKLQASYEQVKGGAK